MSAITVRDLPRNQELDARAMSAVRGGYAGYPGYAKLGAFANVNVNVGIDQSIVQLQNVEVNALNNVGVIGAKLGPLALDVSPKQFALANVAF